MVVLESRFPVGSSANIIWGFTTRALAIPTRCCCPPDIWLGICLACPPTPTRSMYFLASLSLCLLETPRKERGRATFSRAFMVFNRLYAWKMNPTFSRRKLTSWRSVIFSIWTLPISISPLVGFSNPASMLRRVDLPEPEAPTMATNSPLYISKSSPSRARTLISPTRYILYKFFTRMTTGLVSFTVGTDDTASCSSAKSSLLSRA